MHLRRAHARRRSLFYGKNGDVLQRITSARDHRRYGSGLAASTAQRDPTQDIHPRPDGELFLWGMPVHENEHAGKSVRRALEDGTGNHPSGTAAQARRSADPAHARAEPVGAVHLNRPQAIEVNRPYLLACQSSLVTFHFSRDATTLFVAHARGPAAGTFVS